MPKYIAVAGKGGTGKTTVAANLVRYLAGREDGRSVLAIDADPNSNFGEALGLAPRGTIADVLEETKQTKELPAGMTRQGWIQYRLSQLVEESDRFDLLTMGTPEGPGCYCYPNDLLRGHLSALGANYGYVVIDNEAGLEHLSRRVEQEIDVLLVVTDPTARGVRSAGRVTEIIRNLKTKVSDSYLIVNRATSGGDLAALDGEIERTGLKVAGTIPEDPAIREYDLRGTPLTELPVDGPAVRAMRELFARLPL
ncbi:MAG: AAA family ATPase [Bacillota bacterium]|nr:AAA family ATPase [Bacillota bacterium]